MAKKKAKIKAKVKPTNEKPPKVDDRAKGGLSSFLLELYPKLNDPANIATGEAVLDAAQLTGVLSQEQVDEARKKKNEPAPTPEQPPA